MAATPADDRHGHGEDVVDQQRRAGHERRRARRGSPATRCRSRRRSGRRRSSGGSWSPRWPAGRRRSARSGTRYWKAAHAARGAPGRAGSPPWRRPSTRWRRRRRRPARSSSMSRWWCSSDEAIGRPDEDPLDGRVHTVAHFVTPGRRALPWRGGAPDARPSVGSARLPIAGGSSRRARRRRRLRPGRLVPRPQPHRAPATPWPSSTGGPRPSPVSAPASPARPSPASASTGTA